MYSRILHPGLALLLRYQARARCARLARGFMTPRKLALSSAALLLAVVWLGNAAASIVLREPWAPGTLRNYVPLALLVYALWHVLKAACFRPKEGIAWRPAERELLLGGPLRRSELAAYHLAAVVASAALKAGVFTLLMLPDLGSPAAALLGALLALLLLDLFRLSVEIAASSVSRSTYLKFRAAALLLFGAAAMSVIAAASCRFATMAASDKHNLTALARPAIEAAAELRSTWIGRALEAPFVVFAEVITAPALSPALAGWVLLAVGMTAAAAWLAIRLDAVLHRAAIARERREYGRLAVLQSAAVQVQTRRKLPRIFCGGAGALAWRQFVGIRKNLVGLLLAMIPPAVLTWLPLLVVENANAAVLNVVGGLAFYTFLLLPAAMRFDFRRDLERMLLLKTLPLRPATVVLGQLAAPVVAAWGFQLAVLIAAWMVRPLPAGFLLMAWLLLGPANVLIFALENLFYVLYPHRLQQEGIEIFLRSTLTFTAKGLLFALLSVAVWAWLTASVKIVESGIVGSASDHRTVFAAGAAVLLLLTAAATVCALVHAYSRFDPVQDMPA